jgi:hypothetical protein
MTKAATAKATVTAAKSAATAETGTVGNDARSAVRAGNGEAGAGPRSGSGLRHGSASEQQCAGHCAGTQYTCGRAAQ